MRAPFTPSTGICPFGEGPHTALILLFSHLPAHMPQHIHECKLISSYIDLPNNPIGLCIHSSSQLGTDILYVELGEGEHFSHFVPAKMQMHQKEKPGGTCDTDYSYEDVCEIRGRINRMVLSSCSFGNSLIDPCICRILHCGSSVLVYC